MRFLHLHRIASRASCSRMSNLSQLMSDAWRLARKGQRRFGGSVRSYLAVALRLAWRSRRTVAKKVVATAVAMWQNVTVVRKRLGDRAMTNTLTLIDIYISLAGVGIATIASWYGFWR